MDYNVNDKSKYFAAKDGESVANTLMHKANAWYNELAMNGYLWKIRDAWMAYEGIFFDNSAGSHKITFGGEQGELVNIAVNHYRNISDHVIAMITSSRPSFEARAANTDARSLVQTKLANSLLEYYMREKRLEKYLETAVKFAVVLGSGFIKMSWNAMAGEVGDVDENGVMIHEGDVEFENLSPFDVYFDSSKGTSEHDWIVTRSFKNKYDLIAKFPELEEKIISLPTKSDIFNFRFAAGTYGETDDIPIYEFYHRKTESMPDGRYMLYLSGDLVLMDTPLPYRNIPVYRISPANILGTPYGVSPLFNLLPLQEAVNTLYSTILTNQHAFGVQNLYVPRGADVQIRSLEGGLNIVEGNSGAGKPEALNLTQTPGEVFQFLGKLEQEMERISGINSVVRGNPEASLKSGTALALVQSTALQFISPLQMSYIRLLEDIGTGLINMLRDFAHIPRVAVIAGKANKAYVEREFTGDDLALVNRVIVGVGNPLSKCLAKDTPVLMFDGSIKMVQDIVIGDLIMGPDSSPRTVGNVNSGTETMYEITSKDSHRQIKYGCNESHILTLKYCSDDYRYDAKQGDIIDISVRDYLKLPERHKRLLQGFTTGVEFYKKQELIIPPYILGSWLGDGNSSTTSLTTMDEELRDAWKAYADSIGMQVRISENKQPNKSRNYFITSGQAHGKSDRNPFMNNLRMLDLIGNKHIPNRYLISSRKERLELLAGLIDTDGHRIDETFIFTQKNERLSMEVVHLAKSLGFRVTYKKIKTIPSKLVGNLISEVYKISIGGDTWEIPTKLPRKQAIKKEKARNPLNYGINVECKGMGTYYGFTLIEEPHFLLGDFTVTHNTTAGKTQIASELLQYQLLKTPEQYFTVLNTGNLETMTEDTQDELILIKKENETMLSGKAVKAMAIDQHVMHIKGHRSIMSDPEMREPENEQLAALALNHINEHIEMLKSVDPALLAIIGEQSLQAPPPAPGQEGQMPPEATGFPQEMGMMGEPNMLQNVPEARMPNIPQPPPGASSPEENMQKLQG